MDTPLIIALLIAVGGALIFGEFFVPGGILGVLGALALMAMTVMVFLSYWALWGGVALAGSAGVGVLYLVMFIMFFQKSTLGKHMTLGNSVQGQSAPEMDHEAWMGKRGEAVTALRPVGKAVIDGQRVEVQAEMGLIALGTAVEVVRVAGSRLLVREVTGT